MPRLLLIAVAALGLLVVCLRVSAALSLDRARSHRRATAGLPRLEQTRADGLVRLEANGLEFRARVAGLANDGPGLVLIHGFPESSIMWAPLIERAAAAGFRVLAYDQRGFSPGARPPDVADYRLDRLVEDVFAVADAAGFERFHLVGHDWGAVVGWVAAARSPARVATWTALSIPHPAAIFPREDPQPTPAYVRVFRWPGVAETLLGFGDRWLLHRVLWPALDPPQRAEYDALYAEPGALAATLALYRALAPGELPEAAERPVTQPVLYVYGRRDLAAYVAPSVQARLPRWVDGPFERLALDAGHWLIEDEEARVVDAVMAHLDRFRGLAPGPGS